MTYLPCADRENDPNDWFIERDGKQYDDEGFPGVTFEAAETELEKRLADDPDHLGTVADVFEELEAAARKAALRRRRNAKDLCFTQCEARAWCLNGAMERQEKYGTAGGYYPEERRAMQREIDRRRSRELSLLD